METAVKQTNYSEDLDNNKITAVRDFDAAPEEVWNAWTDSRIVDQWWAPKPWKARTRSMDFNEGGVWIYSMEGPEGEKSWCRAEFETINAPVSYTAMDAFCDENGEITSDFPRMHWSNVFSKTETGTRVISEISFENLSDLKKIVEMGFKEGFAAAHTNLDEIFARRSD
jgi:uncharacterized protein YndB with AHSA1/START domain